LADKFVGFRDGGKSNEEAITRLINKISGSNNAGKIGVDDYKVKQNTSPNMTILVTEGDFVIPYLDYFFHTWSTVDQSVTISAADPSFGRIDRLVAYIDLAVVSSSTTNNEDAIVFMNVAGSPSGSPAAVNDAAVQTAVGAGNPWEELAQITVDAAVTSIVNAKIADTRAQFIVGGGVGGAEFSIHGPLIVFNDATPYWLAPKSGTFTSIVARVKTAPTGASLQGRINKNGVQVATFTISAGSSNTSSAINVQFAAEDYFSLDITQIGSTIAGSNLTVALG
jgi:hypothetical protein